MLWLFMSQPSHKQGMPSRNCWGVQTESLVISTIRLVSLWNKMKAQSTKLHLWLYKINIKLYQKIVKLPNSTYTGKKQESWLQQRCNWMETHMVKRIYMHNCHNNLESLHHFQKQASCRLIHKQNIKQDESGCGCPIKTFVARLMHICK